MKNTKLAIEKMIEEIDNEIRGSNIGNTPNFALKHTLNSLRGFANTLLAAEQAEANTVEGLVVLADRKGYEINWMLAHDTYDKKYDLVEEWSIGIKPHGYLNPKEGFTGPTYALAEQSARAYLEGLKDTKGGRE